MLIKRQEPNDEEPSGSLSDEEEEQIVVTRPEDQRDPEADAEFDRELAKMMAESVESRKFDRKPMFDVPLPMRRTAKDISSSADDATDSTAPAGGANTMKFALLSRKGNRQQASLHTNTSISFPTCCVHTLLTLGRLVQSICQPIRTLLWPCVRSSKPSVPSSNASRVLS